MVLGVVFSQIYTFLHVEEMICDVEGSYSGFPPLGKLPRITSPFGLPLSSRYTVFRRLKFRKHNLQFSPLSFTFVSSVQIKVTEPPVWQVLSVVVFFPWGLGAAQRCHVD